MIILEVSINGKVVARAGREDLSVLNAIVNAVGVLGADSGGTVDDDEGQDVFIHVGGMTSKKTGENDEHLRWLPHHELKVGDEITVKVIEGENADEPAREEPVDEALRDTSERELFESARDYYFKHKDRFEEQNG
jgi:hypothetical protein